MKRISVGAVLIALLASPVTLAAVTDEEFDALRNDFKALASRFEELAAENAELRASAQKTEQAVVEVKTVKESAAWAESIKLNGDFRYRYQNDDVDRSGTSTRSRNRVRARPAIEAQLPENVTVGIGLATGSDDPVSTNQTLGGGGSSKGINLDLAYFSWGTPVEGLTVTGGKFKNEFVRAGGNGLLWDSDWRPEGVQMQYANGRVFGNALGSWLEADSSSGSGSEFAWGIQGGVKTEINGASVTAGASYFDIGAQGESCLFESDDCFGNTAVADPGNPGDLLYAFDFTLFEGFVEVAADVMGMPSQFFLDYVVNSDAGSEDTGFAIGARLGKAKKQGSWQASYTYQEIEADAVLGLFADSDFGGGGTDSKGHKFGAAYALSDAAKFKLTYFMTERQDTNGLENGGEKFDIDTLQADFEFKYK